MILGGCKMLKTKKSKTVVIKGRQKTSHPTKDKVQSILSKAGVQELAPRSRTYTAVEYFSKHHPVANKVYKASDVLKANESSLHLIGSTTRKNLLKVFKFKSIKAEGIKAKNKNLFSAFKFIK